MEPGFRLLPIELLRLSPMSLGLTTLCQSANLHRNVMIVHYGRKWMGTVLLRYPQPRPTPKREHGPQRAKLLVGGDVWMRQRLLPERLALVLRLPQHQHQHARLLAGLDATTRLLPRAKARVRLHMLRLLKPQLPAPRLVRLRAGLDAMILQRHHQVNLLQRQQSAKHQDSFSAVTTQLALERTHIQSLPHLICQHPP